MSKVPKSEEEEYDPANDPRSTEELIAAALEEMDTHWMDLGPDNGVSVLRYRCNRDTFETAKLLGQDSDPRKRKLCAQILGDLGEYVNANPDSDDYFEQRGERIHPFEEESVDFLLEMLEKENDTDVMYSIGFAFGLLKNPRPVETLVKLKNHDHEDVRYGVVHGLLGQKDERAIQALIDLSQDEDTDVRDWATFGLGSSLYEVDTPEIRAALYRNIDDEDEETRYEAIQGLVHRQDRGIIPRILHEITTGEVEIESSLGSDFVEMLYVMRDEIDDPRLPPIIEKALEIYPWLTTFDEDNA